MQAPTLEGPLIFRSHWMDWGKLVSGLMNHKKVPSISAFINWPPVSLYQSMVSQFLRPSKRQKYQCDISATENCDVMTPEKIAIRSPSMTPFSSCFFWSSVTTPNRKGVVRIVTNNNHGNFRYLATYFGGGVDR